uniref:Uncharacterized protein n=1 Tax=Panagrolaimus superbus TaxID=310955 RepID=A0A914XZ21_9BILA
MHPKRQKLRIEECDIAKMRFHNFSIRFGDYVALYPSCSPKIENGFVKLNVLNASSECPISVQNAKLKQDVVVVTPNGNSSNPLNKLDENANSGATFNIGIYGWIFVLFSIFVNKL